jgi:hypothetical protein
MIQANELRIGNYVLINGMCQQVNSINAGNHSPDSALIAYCVGDVEESEYCASATVLPFPISKDVLVGCGFEFHDYFKFWQKKIDGKGTDMEINQDYDIIDFMRKPLVKNISSLHQLQNIYFALKGNELKFSRKMSAAY